MFCISHPSERGLLFDGSGGSDLERQYEQTIRGTVEGVIQAAQNPRTAVSITLQIMSDDGALLACALNAACAALVDAAVPMTSTFGAAHSWGVHVSNGHQCMDDK